MDIITSGIALIVRAVQFIAVLYGGMGIITFSLAIKDHNGPEMKTSIMQIAGGAMMYVAGTLISTATF